MSCFTFPQQLSEASDIHKLSFSYQDYVKYTQNIKLQSSNCKNAINFINFSLEPNSHLGISMPFISTKCKTTNKLTHPSHLPKTNIQVFQSHHAEISYVPPTMRRAPCQYIIYNGADCFQMVISIINLHNPAFGLEHWSWIHLENQLKC